MTELKELTPQERYNIVSYRIENAVATLKEVDSHIENHFYNTAVNRMYYACYYAACALLIANKIVTKSHNGVRQMFSLHFVKTGLFPMHFGRYYNELFNGRTSGDYEDLFNQDLDTVSELLPKATEFVSAVKGHVDKWLAEHATDAETNQ